MDIQDIYPIGEIQRINIADIQKQVAFNIPQDYLDFITKHGLGNISDLILFWQASPDFFKLNFADYSDMWDWDDPTLLEKVTHSLYIASTIDGDSIYIIDDSQKPYVIMPRHGLYPMTFTDLQAVLNHYIQLYDLQNDWYFDSSFNQKIEYFQTTQQDLSMFKNQLIEQFQHDKVFNIDTQPKFIYQEIGGWIYIDPMYQNTIRIKYQTPFTTQAEKYLSIINDFIK